MWTTAPSGKLTSNATLTMRNMFEGTCKNYYHYYFGTSILGDPGAVSWARKNGDESFQERARAPLGCYSWRPVSRVIRMIVCDLAQKNNLVPNKKPVSIALLSRSSCIRKFNRKLNCPPYMFGSCRRGFFSENKTHKTKEILQYSDSRKKLEVAWKWGYMTLAANLK